MGRIRLGLMSVTKSDQYSALLRPGLGEVAHGRSVILDCRTVTPEWHPPVTIACFCEAKLHISYSYLALLTFFKRFYHLERDFSLTVLIWQFSQDGHQFIWRLTQVHLALCNSSSKINILDSCLQKENNYSCRSIFAIASRFEAIYCELIRLHL